MMSAADLRPVVWPLETLLSGAPGFPAPVYGWVTPSVRDRAMASLPGVRWVDLPPAAPGHGGTLVAIGGGTLLDEAKAWRSEHAKDVFLVAVPSLWGSGAEASPVVVLTRDGRKTVRLGAQYLPDARVVWPELAANLPRRLAQEGCGDAWAHATEAFFSPLADDTLREQLASLMHEMLAVGVGRDSRWFELGARACALQARAGVGLVHGMAHTLELPLRAERSADWGHARLCSTLLWPVTCFQRSVSPRWDEYARAHGLPTGEILRTFRRLFDAEGYEHVRALLASRWKDVLRDPCTRTNGVLVRPGHLAYFLETDFRHDP